MDFTRCMFDLDLFHMCATFYHAKHHHHVAFFCFERSSPSSKDRINLS